MSIVDKKSGVISIEEIAKHENLDKKMFRIIRMDGDKVMKKFSQQFNDTKAKILENVSVHYIIKSYSINEICEDTVRLEQGIDLECKMLSRVLDKSEEVMFSVVTVQGYDELEDNAAGTMEALFLDGWGTAVLSCGHDILTRKLKEELEKKDIITTSEWSPGQHQVSIALQEPLFENLKPEEIGVTLSESLMMHPKKSESGFTGLGHDRKQSQIVPCDVCPRRETCPSAHGTGECD